MVPLLSGNYHILFCRHCRKGCTPIGTRKGLGVHAESFDANDHELVRIDHDKETCRNDAVVKV